VAREKESFLGRWSRLKEAERKPPEKKVEAGEAPQLPPVDELTPQSDFKDFMHPQVKDALRRVALKKLFTDPHFNTPDPFEPFSGDWTAAEGISDEMLKTLNQARTHIFDDYGKKKEEQPQEEQELKPQTTEASKEDEPRREDT
jgi:Protein of unknown function (DUF3306)